MGRNILLITTDQQRYDGLGYNGVRDRGSDGDCSPPPAHTRTGGIPASGSYLECLTANRTFGQG